METALHEQREEFEAKKKLDVCFRAEESLVNLNSRLAQVVIGIRRSGKSTLCMNVIKKSGLNFAYVNFDDERSLTTPLKTTSTIARMPTSFATCTNILQRAKSESVAKRRMPLTSPL